MCASLALKGVCRNNKCSLTKTTRLVIYESDIIPKRMLVCVWDDFKGKEWNPMEAPIGNCSGN